MFTKGQKVTFTHAKGTRYEEAPIIVEYVERYFYGFDEHVVIYPDGSKVAVLERDLSV